MSTIRTTLVTMLMVLFTGSCSVISQQMRTESEPAVPFKRLAQEKDRYLGKTVILGGYILKTKNLADKTIIEVIQAPLNYWDEPKSKDLSQGRFIVSHKGYLEPEVYSKDRKVTVPGNLVGCTSGKVETCGIDSREIYIWPENDYSSPYYYPGEHYYWHGYRPYRPGC